ncbi:MAG: sigma 54-interacting transcriptional regulator [Gemmata sp.]
MPEVSKAKPTGKGIGADALPFAPSPGPRPARVSGSHQIKVDVRAATAPNRPLKEAVRAGPFRRDRFYRLPVAQLTRCR